jgi:hypothetical protein
MIISLLYIILLHRTSNNSTSANMKKCLVFSENSSEIFSNEREL